MYFELSDQKNPVDNFARTFTLVTGIRLGTVVASVFFFFLFLFLIEVNDVVDGVVVEVVDVGNSRVVEVPTSVVLDSEVGFLGFNQETALLTSLPVKSCLLSMVA